MVDQESGVQQTVINKPGRRWIRWLAGIVLMTVVAMAGGGYWLLNTASGLKGLLATVERLSDETVRFENVEGIATAMRVGRLHYQDESSQLEIRQLKINWSPGRLLNGKLLIHTVNIRAVDIYSQSSDDETTLPDDLSLPVDLVIENLLIGALQVYSIGDKFAESGESQQPDFALTGLSTRLETDSWQHRISHLAFNSMAGALKASGQIETTSPFNLKASLRLDDSEKWGATHMAVSGTLEQMDVKLRHRNLPLRGFVDAQLRPFASSSLAMVKTLNAVIGDLNPAEFDSEMPQANLSMQLKLQSADTDESSDANHLQGFLRIKNSNVTSLDQDGLPLTTLQTKVMISEDAVKLDDLEIELAGKGRVSGNVSWQINQAFGLAELAVSNLNPAAIDTQLQAASINGTINLTGDTDQQQFNVKLSDKTLKLDAAAVHSADRIVLERLSLRHGQSNLTGSGELNLAGENTSDNSQSFNFTGQLSQFNIADFVQGHESNLNLKLVVAGNLSPELTATLDYHFEQSHLNRQPVNGKGKVEFIQPMAVATQTDLQIGSNSLKAHGKLGNLGDTLSLHIDAPMLAQTGLGLSGALNAQIDLHGTLDMPAIDFEIDSKQLGLPGDLSMGSLNAAGKLHDEIVVLKLTASQVSDAGKKQKKLFDQFDLGVDGKIRQHVILADLHIDDEQTVTLRAEGGLAGFTQTESAPVWEGLISALTVTGQLPVKLLSPASVKLGSDQAAIDHVQLAVAGGTATIEKTFWSPERWNSTGQFAAIGLHPGSELIPKENILQLGGKWAIQSRGSLEGDIEIFREKGDWYLPGDFPHALGINALTFRAQAGNGQLTGQFELVSEHIGNVNAKIALPIAYSKTNNFFPSGTPLNGELNLKTPDLSWLDHLVDGTLQSGGELELQAKIAGTLDKPVFQGSVTGKQLAFALPEQGLNLDQGQLAARFDESALHIDRLHFVSPQESPPQDRLLKKLKLDDKPGSVEITGSLGFSENAHQLSVVLDHVYLVHPPHYWIVASGASTAKMFNNVLDFDGDITADAGLITQPPITRPELASDIVFKDDEAESQSASEADEQSTIVNLHADLNLGKQFFLRVAGLEGRLDGSLLIQNDEKGALSAIGSIATRSTTYKAYGQNLTVERGIVNFHGPLDDPGLNIRAVRKGLDVEAGVEVAGTVRHPKIKLISSPNVPDTEKLSWIVLGRAPDASGLDTSLLVTAASSIMGGQSGFGVTDRIRDFFGFDELTFRQGSTPGSSQTTRTGLQSSPFSSPYALAGSTLGGQIGTIGKRISSRAYLSYERGITTAAAGITKLTYSVTPSITVVTQAGEDSAVDLFYTFRFD